MKLPSSVSAINLKKRFSFRFFFGHAYSFHSLNWNIRALMQIEKKCEMCKLHLVFVCEEKHNVIGNLERLHECRKNCFTFVCRCNLKNHEYKLGLVPFGKLIDENKI